MVIQKDILNVSNYIPDEYIGCTKRSHTCTENYIVIKKNYILFFLKFHELYQRVLFYTYHNSLLFNFINNPIIVQLNNM